jgi:fluoroquinolone transport system ATP-binding protein
VRALLTDPALRFLDAPTTGQDPARARRTRDLIKHLRADGRTVFLTTHNMAEADEVCDRVAFLAHGRIAVTGAPEALKRAYGQAVLAVTLDCPNEAARCTFPMEGIGRNEEFLGLLALDHVVAMHTLEASLDDVFIKATGLSPNVLTESLE